MTFAAIDWVMSLEPHWYSTIYGILIIGGQILTALAFVIPIVAVLGADESRSQIFSPGILHDLGNLLLGFIMLWAYFSLSQFLIIWAGNLPEEIPWYLKRLEGGWQWVGTALIIFHFALPFAALLSRDLKRNRRTLTVIALTVLVFRFVDLYWLVTPVFSPSQLAVHWLDVVTFVGVGGLWFATYIWCLQGRALLPQNDPAFHLAEGE
jgi:hypothetical protein